MAEKTLDGTILGQKYLEESSSSRDVYIPSCNPVVNVSRASGISKLQDVRSELIHKHSKHINDLKTHYSREIECLNDRIRSLEQSRLITDPLHHQSKQDERIVEEQLKTVQSHLADHVTQLGVANKMVSVLQEQLVVCRKEQVEMRNELVQLREENNLLHDSLKNMQQELEENKASQIDRMRQLLSELEHTQQEYQRVKEQNEQMTEERQKSHREYSNMSTTLAKMEQQRMDDQSTIQSLQDEIMRLQLTTNRHHNMSTHHSLTTYSSPQSAVTVRTSPQYRSSPIKIRASPSPPSRVVPLTRRKWLEQSDASLISGVGPSSHDANDSPGHKTSLDDTLRAVRTGGVTSYGPEQQLELEERVKANMKEVAKAEEDFVRLQEQRKQLEAILQRIPTSGRVTMEMKQKRLHTEEQLDRVVKEIGMVRMLLRSHHALKSTT